MTNKSSIKIIAAALNLNVTGLSESQAMSLIAQETTARAIRYARADALAEAIQLISLNYGIHKEARIRLSAILQQMVDDLRIG